MTEVIEIIEHEQDEHEQVNVDHLSYSTAKKILRKGIDFAVGTKVGLVAESYGDAAKLGVMIHAALLGGNPDWVVNDQFDSFRSNAAKEWKAEQIEQGKIIIDETQFEIITMIQEAVQSHPLAKQLLDSCQLEQKLTAKVNGIDFVGYADGISEDRKIIFDLKTTAQFDNFKGKWFAINQDFDLQASVYSLFGDNAKYYFIVAETIAPFRVQIFGTSAEFIESGNTKLDEAIEEFKRFRERTGANDQERVSFNLGEKTDLDKVTELGDWS